MQHNEDKGQINKMNPNEYLVCFMFYLQYCFDISDHVYHHMFEHQSGLESVNQNDKCSLRPLCCLLGMLQC